MNLRLAAAPILACLLTSCASVTVKNVTDGNAANPRSKPKHIYVEPFSVAHADVKQHPMRKHPGQLASDSQKLVADFLVAELTKSVAPASLIAAGARPAGPGWIVSGDFTRLNEGSRIMRMGLGLGMGGTKMETRVAVRNLPAQNKPFLAFQTTGGSNAMPGAATNPVPFSSAASALLQSSQGVTDDAGRTARQITGVIAEYAVKRGWIAAGAGPQVKHAR